MPVQNGTLHTGDCTVVGAVYGKVRALFDHHGHPVKQADPSTPVEDPRCTGRSRSWRPIRVAGKPRLATSSITARPMREASAPVAAPAHLLDQVTLSS